MKIVTADITGSLIVNGVDVTNNVVSSSIFSGSIAGRVTNLEAFSSSLDATFATDAQVAASILVLSQSVQTSQAALSSSYALTSGSFVATSASYVAVSGSYVIVSGSYAAASASLSTRVTNTEATASVNTQASASFAAYSGSVSTRLTQDEANITTLTNASASFAVVSSSFSSTSQSVSSRVTLIEGQYATTGSNIFSGTQRITEASNAISFTSTASLYTDGGLRVSKDSYVSGTAYFNNITVYGTSSIQYITSSQVNIGSNIITVNTDTPAVRFGGLSVFDSGSTQLTGSLFWDSQNNHWIYSNPSGSTYNSAMLMNGPRNTGSLGSEQGTTFNALMKGQGGDHITSSQMFDDGTTVRIPGNLQVTGSIYASNLTGSIDGSNLINASVANAKLTNSTISGIALGSNLATLTIGTGLSGTSYNGSTGVTIANTGVTSNVAGTGISVSGATGAVTITNSGVTSIVAGTGISINQGTGAVTVTNTITNNNQLTNGAGYITSAGTAAAISQTITAGSEGNLVFATIGTNDFFRIRAGGSSNAGFVEIATADDGTEPIYVRQYTGEFTTLTRTATLLDGSGNTSFPGTITSAGNTIITSANISSQSVSSASTAGLVNATSGGAIQTWDIRTIAPSSMTAGRLGFGFTSYNNNNTSPWADYLHLRSYTDGSGGADNLITFSKSGIGMRIWQQTFGSSTAYSSYVDVLHSSNYSSYALPLSGGTLSGGLSGTTATFTGNVTVSSGNATGGGIILADDGDIVDLNDAYCSMRFSYGVRIFSANKGGSAVIKLGNGGDIVASADITAYGSPSDISLKENIEPLEKALSKILKLQGVTFDWKEDSETRQYTKLKEDIGFIAQQVQEVIPELVRKNDNGLLSLRDRGLTALLVEAIKEQQSQIEELKTLINGLTK
jgi:hypothetical protein